jgi:DNA-binding GntR family transcriptional regulator
MNSEHDMAWPSLRKIEGETGLSRPTVVKYLKILEAEGWLAIKRGDMESSSIYYACFPEGVVKELNQGGKTESNRVVKELYRNKQVEVNKRNKGKGNFVSTRGRTLQEDLSDTSWAD